MKDNRRKLILWIGLGLTAVVITIVLGIFISNMNKTTLPPTPVPSPSPTPNPTPSPTISLGTKYSIEFVPDSIETVFNGDDSKDEMTFKLRIADQSLDKLGSITVRDHETCKGDPFDPSVISAEADLDNKVVSDDGIYADVLVRVDINTTDIYEITKPYPGYFNPSGDDNNVIFNFCIRSELGQESVINVATGLPQTYAISYKEVKFELSVRMETADLFGRKMN